MSQISVDISQYYLKNIVVNVESIDFTKLQKFSLGDLLYYRCNNQFKLMKIESHKRKDDIYLACILKYDDGINPNNVKITEDNCVGLYSIME